MQSSDLRRNRTYCHTASGGNGFGGGTLPLTTPMLAKKVRPGPSDHNASKRSGGADFVMFFIATVLMVHDELRSIE